MQTQLYIAIGVLVILVALVVYYHDRLHNEKKTSAELYEALRLANSDNAQLLKDNRSFHSINDKLISQNTMYANMLESSAKLRSRHSREITMMRIYIKDLEISLNFWKSKYHKS